MPGAMCSLALVREALSASGIAMSKIIFLFYLGQFSF